MSVLQRSPAPPKPAPRLAPGFRDAPRSWARRLSDETGIALVMALAVMLVLSILVTSVIAYTSANSRDASLKQSGQSAFSLAEAGLNAALAQLYAHYYTNSGTANNNATLYSPSWFGAGVTTSKQSPSSSAACTSSSTCMSWGVVSWTPGGSGITKGTLVLRGQGSVPNPTGGTALTRTVTEKIDVRQPPQLVTTPSYWSGIYSGETGNACDLTLGQGVSATAPIYVAGNLCVLQAASIQGSGVTLKVLGNIRLQNGNSNIGKTSAVKSVQVGGGCVKSTNGAYTTPCPINKSSTDIWDLSGLSTAPPPTADPLPSIDWAGVAAQQAGSTTSCTNGQSLTAATFSLTPGSSYSCSITDSTGTSTLGSLNYDATNHTLALSGVVYFSGSLSLSTSSPVTYTGIGSLFVAGTVTAANGSALCVHVASGTCDMANANTTGNADYWDTTKSVLIIQSQGALAATNFAFQGGLYSSISINLGGGQSSTQGPLVSPLLITPGQQLNLTFPSFPLIYSGSLGTPAPPYTLGSAYNGSF